ncbi:hypothetical protein CYFUS_000893 [Cystobacter fuscus]|uniref:Fido domain-containing protein n=1 Tax=Cystobacter fuscus TaxID=43 RepID=A0A250IW46_9BACT|nr:Fic family protein [Cystobacter fuscus]ATB35480.1 hypothetical protein CYFUS_000893 [Cystobacter fuscus]
MRKYEKTHPWLKFSTNLANAPPSLWMLLGEARSKCDHVAGAPLRPTMGGFFHQLYLAKGVLATTAIEGNTLSEEEVSRRIEGKLPLPKSREYLGKEVDNVISAMNLVWDQCMNQESKKLTVAEIKEFNRLVLNGLSLEEDVTPGEVRQHSVGVGSYRAPPAEDCEYLLQRMCDWLNGPDFEAGEETGPVVIAIVKAILAHLYLAWIHPFGDGNGRTARMLEFKTLTDAGVPSPAVHLLSNHYNATRMEYYRQLERASKSGGDVLPFISYAVQGFVDQIRTQVDAIRLEQLEVAWRSHVYDLFADKNSSGDERRKHLILDLAEYGPQPRSRLTLVSPRVAEAYAGKTPKTLARDINMLLEAKLLLRQDDLFIANKGPVLAFIPESNQNVSSYLKRLLDAHQSVMRASRQGIELPNNPSPPSEAA